MNIHLNKSKKFFKIVFFFFQNKQNRKDRMLSSHNISNERKLDISKSVINLSSCYSYDSICNKHTILGVKHKIKLLAFKSLKNIKTTNLSHINCFLISS